MEGCLSRCLWRGVMTGMVVLLLASASGSVFAQEDEGMEQPPRRLRTPHATSTPPANEDIIAWMYRKADKYWHDGDYAGALNCWRLIMVLEPDIIEAYEVSWWLLWSMAVSAEQEGKKEEAQTYHQRAVEVLERGVLYNPNVYDVYFEFGQYYMVTQQYDKARTYFARAAQFKEAPVMVKRNWAHACERAGNLKACIAVWQQILQENPTDAVAILNLRRIQAQTAGKQ